MNAANKVIVAIAATAGLVLTGCASDEPGNSNQGTDSSVTIGLISPQTGPSAINGIYFANGVRMAIENINAEGGVLDGISIEIEYRDDAGDPEIARQGMVSLVNELEVPAVIGPYGSSTCLAAAAVSEQAKTPTLCSGTSDAITQQGYSYLVNSSTTASTYIGALFSVLDTYNDGKADAEKVTKIALIHEDGAYGKNVAAQMETLVSGSQYQLTDSLPFTAGDPNLRPLLTRIAGTDAQVIAVGGFGGDVINTLKAVETTGASGRLVAGFTGAVVTPSVAELGSLAENLLGLTNWNSDFANRPELTEFVKEFTEKYGDAPSADAANGWVTAYALKEAIEAAGEIDREAIHLALRTISFESGITAPYQTRFDENGLMASQAESVAGVQLRGGQFVTVWPTNIAAADFVFPGE